MDPRERNPRIDGDERLPQAVGDDSALDDLDVDDDIDVSDIDLDELDDDFVDEDDDEAVGA